MAQIRSAVATCAQEVVKGAAGLVKDAPIVGIVCTTFLSFVDLVDTAKNNQEDLAVLRDLCIVVVRGALERGSAGRAGRVEEDFTRLGEHVKRAKEVAKLSNGRLKQLILARKICKEIAAVREDILAFCTAIELVLANDVHAKIDKLQTTLGNKMEEMEKLAVTQADYEAVEREVEDLRAKIEAKDKASSELVGEMRYYKEALHDMRTKMEEQSSVQARASEVDVPSGAPRIRDWYVERNAVVSSTCDLLRVGKSTTERSEEPRMVGLAGPSGAGKSTVASMVIARVDVRASFHKGVLWLQVGEGAEDRLPELMIRLAGMVYETVMRKTCRPPPQVGLESDPEDGVAYILDEVDESSRRSILVVADNVWEVEVLQELKRVGVWVLYTTRDGDLIAEEPCLLAEEPPLRLDQVREEEAELVLRRAAELDTNVRLPNAAFDLMKRSNYVVLDLALVGRWSMVRKRSDEKAWQKALDSVEAQQLIMFSSWRHALIKAGLDELAGDNRKLYLALAVVPKGLAFPLEAAAVLLYGERFSPEDLEAAGGVAATLERWSILALEGGGEYRVHDVHADFLERNPLNPETLNSWRGYMSSVRALVNYSSFSLLKIWEGIARRVGGNGAISRPYRPVLDATDPSSAELPKALGRAARFYWRQKDWKEAYNMISDLLRIHEDTLGRNSLEVASTLHSLAACALNAGWREKAAVFCRRALKIRKEELGDKDLDVAGTLYSLGVCVYDQGQTKDAEAIYEQALAIRKDKLGDDHPDVAQVLYSLGMCVYGARRVEEAEKLFRQALTIREKKLGAGHPDVSSTRYRLGECACVAGRMEEAMELLRGARVRSDAAVAGPIPAMYGLSPVPLYPACYPDPSLVGPCITFMSARAQEAEEFYKLALTIQEETLGSDHLDVANTLYELGVCAAAAWRTKDAEDYYRRALSVWEKVAGIRHPKLASILWELGGLASRAGMAEEALELLGRALVIREETLGVDHPDVASTLYKLGLYADSAGMMEEADDFYERALAIDECMDGVHLAVAGALYTSAGYAAFDARRRGEVHQCYRRALFITEAKLGVDHPDVALSVFSLGICDFIAGSSGEGEERLRRALSTLEEKVGVDHPDVVNILFFLGRVAYDAGRPAEGEEYFRRTHSILEAGLGDDPTQLLHILHCLGFCAETAGREAEATEYCRRALEMALEIREHQPGFDQSPNAGNILYSLGDLAKKAGKMRTAQEYYLRALEIHEKAWRAEEAFREKTSRFMWMAYGCQSENPNARNILYNLGVLADKVGKMEAAEQYLLRALTIKEDQPGSSCPYVGLILNSLGACACKAGKMNEAEEWFRQALVIGQKTLGADHPSVAETRVALAKLRNVAIGRVAVRMAGVLLCVAYFLRVLNERAGGSLLFFGAAPADDAE